jgi:hypothetical protein
MRRSTYERVFDARRDNLQRFNVALGDGEGVSGMLIKKRAKNHGAIALASQAGPSSMGIGGTCSAAFSQLARAG